MPDRLSQAKEFASEKWGGLATALSTQRQMRALHKQITDLVGERDRLMADIGLKVYALYGRGKVRNADLLPLCERITAIGERIEGLNEQVRELAEPTPRGGLAEAPVADDTEIPEDAPEAEAEGEGSKAPAEPSAEEPCAPPPAPADPSS